MGCKQSKEGYIPASDETTSKRKRATLQLDLTYDTKAADDERLAALLASTTASTPLPHKTGLTPVMTPTTAGAGASGQSSPPPRPLSDDGRPSSRRWSALAGDGSARAPSFKSPVKCRGSTAELSTESEGGEDDYGSDTESDSDSERESEGESETSRLLVPTSASKARKPGRETGPACAVDASTKSASKTFKTTNNTPTRRKKTTLPPPPPATLPPGPAEQRAFLDKHRPLDAITAAARTEGNNLHRLVFPDGMSYAGQVGSDGMPGHWGTLVLPDLTVYEGEWRTGRMHGQGALLLPNCNAFWGSWCEGRKHGLGTFLWADGSRHDGFYRAGKRCGVGKLMYATGAVYDGEFECDLRHGSGRLVLPNGSSYDGQWVSDVPHGHGVYVEAGPGGERFEGSWNRGVRCGAGTLVQGCDEGGADGSNGSGGGGGSVAAWYSGNFDDGLPHGDGVMGYGSAMFCGHIEHGVWTGGGGKVDLGDGTGSFEGTWRDGLPRGRGRWRGSPNGDEVDCTFREAYAKSIWPG